MPNLKEIKKTPGIANMPGLGRIHYYTYLNDVLSIPKPLGFDLATSLEEMSVISSSIEMKPGKYMHPIYCTAETGGLKGESQGERDCKSVKRTATIHFPQLTAEVMGLSAAIINSDMLVLVKDRDGRFRMLGSEDYPAEIAPSDDTGTSSTDKKGIDFVISDVGAGPAPIYEGDIPLDESSTSSSSSASASNSASGG